MLVQDRYHVISDERVRQIREALTVILARAHNPEVRDLARKIALLLSGTPFVSRASD